MTLSNKYNRAMARVEVTADMRAHIVEKVSRLDLRNSPKKAPGLPVTRRIIAIAACAMVLLAGAFLVRHVVIRPQGEPQQAIPDIVSCATAAELNKAVGFTVSTVKNLPFDVKDVQYTAYEKKLAQVEYSAGNDAVVFRMAAGSDDISGDYTEYPSAKQCNQGSFTVTIKGDHDRYQLAIWQSGGYSYSLSAPAGVSEQEMLDMMGSVK